MARGNAGLFSTVKTRVLGESPSLPDKLFASTGDVIKMQKSGR